MSAVPRVEPASSATTQQLYEQYGRQIYAYCLQRLRSREEAEDAVQTTFLNAFRALERGTVTEFQQAWLFKIAQNVCLERREASGRRAQLESPSDMQVLQDTAPAHAPQDSEQLIGVEDALQRIPANQRKAILLREWQGLSYREIGEELDLSQAAVEMLIFRARRSLAAALEQPGEGQTKKRRVSGGRALNFGSLVTALKTMFTGGAAVKAVAVAVTAGAAVVTVSAPTHTLVQHRLAHGTPAPAQTTASVQAFTPVVAPAVKHVAAPARVMPEKATAAARPAHQGGAHTHAAPPAAVTPYAVVSQPHAVPSLDPPSARAPAPEPVEPAPAPAVTTTAAPPAAPPTSSGDDNSGKRPKPKPKQQPPPKSGGGPPPPPPPPVPDPQPQPQPQPAGTPAAPAGTPAPVDTTAPADPIAGDGTGDGKGKGRKDRDHGQGQGGGSQAQQPSGGPGDSTGDPPVRSDPGGGAGAPGDTTGPSATGQGGDTGNGRGNGNAGDHGRGHGGDPGGSGSGDQGPGQGQGKGNGGGHGHGDGH